MSLLLTGAGPSLWTPYSLGAALKAWWNADDHGTANMTDDGAGLISSWMDRIGGVAATGTTTQRPTWSSTSYNSAKAGVTGDGSAMRLVATALGSIPVGASAGRIFCQMQGLDLAVARSPISYGSGTANKSRRIILAANEQPSVNDGTTSNAGTTGDGLGLHVIDGRWSGTTMEGWRDGAGFAGNPATITSLSTDSTRLVILGNSNTTPAQLSADTVRNIIITDDTLDAGQLTLLRAWMAAA